MENLFELMKEYNLTLRRLPKTETSSYALPTNPTKEEIDNSYEVVMKEMDEEEFKKWCDKGFFKNSRWQNGFVIAKRTKKTIQHQDGWLVKQNNGHDSMQKWNRKYDYFGKTPEEAIMKAVKDIDKHINDAREKIFKAGLYL